ncbi:MAG: hypothetical protein PUC71_02205 [Oscillospiraceae bacterium]|nr:hypothetical protein [Oscillospiraceae bacterium]
MPKQYLDSYADICMKSNRDFDAFYRQIDREIQARGNRQEALRDISIQVMSAVMQNDPDRAGVVEQYFRGYANIKDWQASRQSYHVEKGLYNALMAADITTVKSEMLHPPFNTFFLDLHDANSEINGIFVETDIPDAVLQCLTFFRNGFVVTGTWKADADPASLKIDRVTEEPPQLGLRAALLLTAYLSQKEADVAFHKETCVSRKKVGKKTHQMIRPSYWEVGAQSGAPMKDLADEVIASGEDPMEIHWVEEGKTTKSQKPHIKRARFEGRRVNAKDADGKDIVLEDGTKAKTIMPTFTLAKAMKLPE